MNSAITASIVPDALPSKYTQAATRAEFCALAVALYETATGNEITERAKFNDTTDINASKDIFSLHFEGMNTIFCTIIIKRGKAHALSLSL